MAFRVYKNLVPDSHLHRELEALLEKNGGRATVEEVCTQVLLLPTTLPSLARILVEGLLQGDARLHLSDSQVEWHEPTREEIWRRRTHFLVVDVETTDGARRDQRIIELGVCRIEEGRITDQWSQIINPRRSLSPWVRNLTGITEAMLAKA
ncbi:MAG: hypothetical protein HYU43_08455, partial [Armatimonadetes bacterium]|nr:hypothetical protein [Armatimonadota bacterium]